MSIFNRLFGISNNNSNSNSSSTSNNINTNDPSELAKQWKKELRIQERSIEADIRKIDREITKQLKECKRLAKTGNLSACKLLAKSIATSRLHVTKLHTAVTRLQSISLHVQQQAAQIRVQGIMTSSTQVMHTMNELMKVPELKDTMSKLAREMEKAGLIQELVDDAFASIEDPDLESQTDAEISKIMIEIAQEMNISPGAVPKSAIQKTQTKDITISNEQEEEPVDSELEEMQKRLASL